ncbi:MAG: cell division protein ZapA, partial [Clostridium sp.]
KILEMDLKFKDIVVTHDQDGFKEEFEKLSSEMNIMEEELKKNIREKQTLKSRNKEIKFKLQNYQYKVLDLEKKLVDLQINLAKEKKFKNPLLK